MHMKQFLTVIFAAILLTGCAARPMVEFDQTTNFSDFENFSWRMPEYGKVDDPILDSPLLGQKVRDAVVAALQARGFTFHEQPAVSPADFIVTYHTAEKEKFSDSGLRLGFGTGYWGRSSIIYSVGAGSSSYEEGILIIDILDADSGDLVWRGWRGMRLNQTNFNDSNVHEQVELILSAFPPGTTR